MDNGLNDAGLRARRGVLLVGLASLAARCLLAARMEVTPQEAYAGALAAAPFAGLADHPPLLPWLVALARSLPVPLPPDLALRLPSIVFFSASLPLLHRLAARLFLPAAGLHAVVLAHLCPGVFFAGVLALPWSGLLFFVLLLWYLAVREPVFHGRAAQGALLGLVFGLGCLAHPAMLFALLALLLPWGRRPSGAPGGRWRSCAGFLAGAALPLVPAVLLDQGRFLPALAHLAHAVRPAVSWSGAHLRQALLDLAGTLNPLVVGASAALAAALLWRAAGRVRDVQWRGLGSCLAWGLPPALFFLLLSGAGGRSANLLLPAVVALVVLPVACASGATASALVARGRPLRALAALTALALVLGSAVLQASLALALRPDLSARWRLDAGLRHEAGPGVLPWSPDWGFRELARAWTSMQPEDASFLLAGDWALCAQLEHHLGLPVAWAGSGPGRRYAALDRSRAFLGRTGYLVVADEGQDASDRLEPCFRRISPWKMLTVNRDGRVLHAFRVYRCEGLVRPLSLAISRPAGPGPASRLPEGQ